MELIQVAGCRLPNLSGLDVSDRSDRHLRITFRGLPLPSEIGDDLMAHVWRSREVLEAVDHLSHDEQEELIGILHRRLAQASRG